MRKLLAPAVLIGILALTGCGSSDAQAPTGSSPTSSTPQSTAAQSPVPTAANDELVDGQKFFEELPEESYEENGYDDALPPIEVHSDENSGVDLGSIIIKLKAAERIPTDQVTGITDAYEGYDNLAPIRLTFTLDAQELEGEDAQGAFPLEDMDMTGFYGPNLQPVEQYSEFEDNDGGPELDSTDPKQVAVGEPYDLVRTLWVPDDHAEDDLMAEIAFEDSMIYIDYFVSSDEVTDLK